jgi:hypothetical protein
MTQHTSSKARIVYYRLIRKEPPPEGWEYFVIKETTTAGILKGNHFIAAQSESDAERIIAEDYRTQGSLCAIVRDARGHPTRGQLRHSRRA